MWTNHYTLNHCISPFWPLPDDTIDATTQNRRIQNFA
jgi:hypothetical protein